MGDNDQGQQAEDRPHLPNELTLKVFSYLTKDELVKNAAPVCRQWRMLSYDHELWRELKLDGRNFRNIWNGKVTISKAQQLVRQLQIYGERIIHVRRLELEYWEFVKPGDDRILSALQTLAPGVTSLHLRRIRIMREETAKWMIQMYSRELTHISISLCAFPTGSLHFLDLMCVAPHLASMFLTYNEGKLRWFRPGFLKHSWPNLTEVHIGPSHNEEEELQLLSSAAGLQIKKLTVGDFESLQPYQTLAQFTQVEALDVRFPLKFSDNKALEGLGSLENLQHLTLSQPSFLTWLVSPKLFSLPNLTSTLESFTLKYAHNFDDTCLRSMWKCTALTKLTFISCSRITEEGLHHLVCMLANVKSLHVEKCNGVDKISLAIALFKSSRPDVALSVISLQTATHEFALNLFKNLTIQ